MILLPLLHLQLKKILDHESPRNYSKMIARNLYVATMQADLSDDVVRKGINILKNLTEENRDFSVSTFYHCF